LNSLFVLRPPRRFSPLLFRAQTIKADLNITSHNGVDNSRFVSLLIASDPRDRVGPFLFCIKEWSVTHSPVYPLAAPKVPRRQGLCSPSPELVGLIPSWVLPTYVPPF